MAKVRTHDNSFTVSDLWRGETSLAPWVKLEGQVEGSANIRFDRRLSGAVKRGDMTLLADLTDNENPMVDLSGADDYLFIAVRGAIVAVGDGVVYGWDEAGTPLTVIDNSDDTTGLFDVSSFYDYITESGFDPLTELDFTVSFDTIIIANRRRVIEELNGWSFEQSYNYIVNGSAEVVTELPGAGYGVDHPSISDADAAGPSNGTVVRITTASELDPPGFYVYYDGSPYPGLGDSEELFPRSGDWYRVPDGRGPSGTGDATGDVDAGQSGARYDITTMPHRIVYDEDAGTLTLLECPWRHRISGTKDENPNIIEQVGGSPTVRAVEFHSSRLFLCTTQFIQGSRTNDFFNLFTNDVKVPADNDPIALYTSQPNAGNIRRAYSCGNDIGIVAEAALLTLTSGPDLMSATNVRINSVFGVRSADIIHGYSSNTLVVLDQCKDAHRFQWVGAVGSDTGGLAYMGAINLHHRRVMFDRTINRVFMPNDFTTMLTSDEGETLVHDLMVSGREVEQTAWGRISCYERPVFYDDWNDRIRVVTRDTTEGYSLLSYIHRDREKPSDLEFYPRLDRLEIVQPTAMVYVEDEDVTEIAHTGRDATLTDTFLVTTTEDRSSVFLRPFEIKTDGTARFRGDWTDDQQYLGFAFDASITMLVYPTTRGSEYQIKSMTTFHQLTTDYTVGWSRRDGQSFTEQFWGQRVGSAILGAAAVGTHYREVELQGATEQTEITISSDTPGPMNINVIEYRVLEAGRGQSS